MSLNSRNTSIRNITHYIVAYNKSGGNLKEVLHCGVDDSNDARRKAHRFMELAKAEGMAEVAYYFVLTNGEEGRNHDVHSVWVVNKWQRDESKESFFTNEFASHPVNYVDA